MPLGRLLGAVPFRLRGAIRRRWACWARCLLVPRGRLPGAVPFRRRGAQAPLCLLGAVPSGAVPFRRRGAVKAPLCLLGASPHWRWHGGRGLLWLSLPSGALPRRLCLQAGPPDRRNTLSSLARSRTILTATSSHNVGKLCWNKSSVACMVSPVLVEVHPSAVRMQQQQKQ